MIGWDDINHRSRRHLSVSDRWIVRGDLGFVLTVAMRLTAIVSIMNYKYDET